MAEVVATLVVEGQVAVGRVESKSKQRATCHIPKLRNRV
jgi:hypothetical protein